MRFEMLPNGFIRARCMASGLVALFNRDGTGRGGCVHLERDPAIKRALLAWLAA